MIYIQSNKEKTLPHHFDCACALYGAIENAIDYKLITFEEVQSGKFDNLIKTRCFVGSVEFMREVFKKIGIENPRVPLNSNRTHFAYTIKEIRERISKGEIWFVKPYEIKHFTGLVVDEISISCLKDLPEELIVMAYEPFESKILTEYRVYVHNNKISDIRVYSGDPFVMLPEVYVQNVINNFKSTFPCAYTIDVGLLQSGQCVVVEFNDMWAIGNYGMENDLYVRLLRDRYFEIIKNGK